MSEPGGERLVDEATLVAPLDMAGQLGRADTDARQRHAAMTVRLFKAAAKPRARREEQLVIVAAGKGSGQRIVAARLEPRPCSRVDRHGICVDPDTHAAGLSNLPESLGKSIAEIHAGAGGAIPSEQST